MAPPSPSKRPSSKDIAGDGAEPCGDAPSALSPILPVPTSEIKVVSRGLTDRWLGAVGDGDFCVRLRSVSAWMDYHQFLLAELINDRRCTGALEYQDSQLPQI
ncbi:hypothetical protein ZWY2020_014776 [Hordeum vulgare]|nr:hypothetical protein ZWY2020_014776 [Hordeum vulgare]